METNNIINALTGSDSIKLDVSVNQKSIIILSVSIFIAVLAAVIISKTFVK